MTVRDYHDDIPDHEGFSEQRASWRMSFAEDSALHTQALQTWLAAAGHKYGYHWEWSGVPVIRWPDDIALIQEIIWEVRPSLMIETGVARGGSVVMAASLMAGAGLSPQVLGVDIAILPHTWRAVRECPWSHAIELLEADSCGAAAVAAVHRRISQLQPGATVILTLDSDHAEAHVLRELQALAPLLPVGSVILIADTVIEELPQSALAGRPWGRGNSPLSALKKFLTEDPCYVEASHWSRRALMSEFRDGVIIRNS